MTATAHQRLIDHYDVDDAKVVVIPHGAAGVRRPSLTTGWARSADATWVSDPQGHRASSRRSIASGPRARPHYLVVGETHPKVLERDGEATGDGL
jgi:hypothetical protein